MSSHAVLITVWHNFEALGEEVGYNPQNQYGHVGQVAFVQRKKKILGHPGVNEQREPRILKGSIESD